MLYWMERTRPETVVKINTVTFSPTIKSCQAWIVCIVVFTIIKQPSKMRFFSLSKIFINYLYNKLITCYTNFETTNFFTKCFEIKIEKECRLSDITVYFDKNHIYLKNELSRFFLSLPLHFGVAYV